MQKFKIGDKVKFNKEYFLSDNLESGEIWFENAVKHIKETNNKPLKVVNYDDMFNLYELKGMSYSYEEYELLRAKNKVRKIT